MLFPNFLEQNIKLHRRIRNVQNCVYYLFSYANKFGDLILSPSRCRIWWFLFLFSALPGWPLPWPDLCAPRHMLPLQDLPGNRKPSYPEQCCQLHARFVGWIGWKFGRWEMSSVWLNVYLHGGKVQEKILQKKVGPLKIPIAFWPQIPYDGYILFLVILNYVAEFSTSWLHDWPETLRKIELASSTSTTYMP